MKKLWQFALVVCFLVVRLSAQTREFPETSGNAFLRLCSAADKEAVTDAEKEAASENIMTCVAYVNGFIDGVRGEQAFAKGYTHQKVPIPFCLPDGVENGQIIRIVLKYIRDSPTEGNRSTMVLMVKALGKAYPCPSK
jgi:Rap1a immunity proteins